MKIYDYAKNRQSTISSSSSFLTLRRRNEKTLHVPASILRNPRFKRGHRICQLKAYVRQSERTGEGSFVLAAQFQPSRVRSLGCICLRRGRVR